MTRPTYVRLNLTALKHNLSRVRAFAKDRLVMAMVKANAYGHGLVRVAHTLREADAFGVASLDEGILLKDSGITQPVVLIEGLFNIDEIEEAAKQNFTLVVHHLPHVEMLEQAEVQIPFKIWLKINTGMNRLGIDPSQFSSVYNRLLAFKSVQKPIGFMTHFAEADMVDGRSTITQLELFDKLTSSYEGQRSLANSAAIINWPEAQGDWVRPGLMLYGASPFADKMGCDYDLKPVMTLWSRLIAINPIKSGSRIGYGGTWEAKEDMLIGVVGVGYGDGYPQFAKNGTPTLVNGIECPLVGRVSMDMLTVDLRNIPNAKIGDNVVLWGDRLPVERIAKCSNTTPYEILTRMTPRPTVEIIA